MEPAKSPEPEYYRQRAKHATSLAAHALDPATRVIFGEIAEVWEKMAQSAERTLH